MKNKAKLKEMVIISLFAAIMCIFAPFTIPFGIVPLSLSTFILYFTSVLLGRKAIFPILIYILIGATGLPVFSGGVGGFERILGPTGGFILGYVPCAYISGYITEKAGDSKTLCFTGMLIGTVVMYIIGVPWMIAVLGAENFNTVTSLIIIYILPFVPVDVIKMILAAIIGYSIKKRITP